MIFKNVIEDIQKMVGLQLYSIRPGTEITITEIDEAQNSIVVLTNKGKLVRRSLNELESIWDHLMMYPAVHVEEVLFGSGSSRNQPETILANLPYIEWLKVKGKKHISYVGRDTHPFGTLMQMSSMNAAKIIDLLDEKQDAIRLTAVFAVENIVEEIEILQSIRPGKIISISQYCYKLIANGESYLIISSSNFDVKPGTYAVSDTQPLCYIEDLVHIANDAYRIVNNRNIKLFVRQETDNKNLQVME